MNKCLGLEVRRFSTSCKRVHKQCKHQQRGKHVFVYTGRRRNLCVVLYLFWLLLRDDVWQYVCFLYAIHLTAVLNLHAFVPQPTTLSFVPGVNVHSYISVNVHHCLSLQSFCSQIKVRDIWVPQGCSPKMHSQFQYWDFIKI